MENFGSLILPLLLSALVGYLLGSISFAILLTKAFAHEDVRAHGSGNAGATNVLRVAGKKASALTFLLDFCKCVASVLVGYFLVKHACVANGVDPEMARLGMYAAGFCCMIGHMYPLYFGFRGGKGVVTTAAMMLLLDWRVFLICFAVFLLVFLKKRMVSLSSITTTCRCPCSSTSTPPSCSTAHPAARSRPTPSAPARWCTSSMSGWIISASSRPRSG